MDVYQNLHFLRDLVVGFNESSPLPDVSFLQSKEGQRISALGTYAEMCIKCPYAQFPVMNSFVSLMAAFTVDSRI